MNLYLAGLGSMKSWLQNGTVKPEDLNCLESFIAIKDWTLPFIPRFRHFLLDSGAFTFMHSKKQLNVDWFEYAERYATFVRDNQIERYFELDLDRIIGLEKTNQLRAHIERIVGWPSIPVWHETRDKTYFIDEMCKKYPYIAIGGIAKISVNRKAKLQMFPWFIHQAHKHGAMIHGLGYTHTENFSKYRFDSVDSTTWLSGCMYGEVHHFENGHIVKWKSVNGGVKTRSIREQEKADLNNLTEWMKMIQHCEIFL